jgi:coenzyme F420 hydrogenase subunit beta
MTVEPQPVSSGLTIPVVGGAARPGLCTDCGVSRMGDGKACGHACQFVRRQIIWDS